MLNRKSLRSTGEPASTQHLSHTKLMRFSVVMLLAVTGCGSESASPDQAKYATQEQPETPIPADQGTTQMLPDEQDKEATSLDPAEKDAVEAIEKLDGIVDIREGHVAVVVASSNMTDADLVNIKGLTHLSVLNLGGTQVSDAGVESLNALRNLEALYLNSTRVTDEGLASLNGLNNLMDLNLYDTVVSDAGIAHLKELMKLDVLDISNTKVTDKGLQHLKGLTKLRMLYLAGTAVTDAGVTELQSALPMCQIER